MSRYLICRDGFRSWSVYDREEGMYRIRLTSRRACERAIAQVEARALEAEAARLARDIAGSFAAHEREAVTPASETGR